MADDPDDSRTTFANPGSALRAASKRNPRNLPCPTCKQPNRLTPKDKAAAAVGTTQRSQRRVAPVACGRSS